MAITGQTLARFCGALILGGLATAIDHPSGASAPASKPAAVARRRVPFEQLPQAVTQRIAPGKRAFAVVYAGVSATAGMIRPNSRVDVLLVAPPSEAPRREAKVIYTNVRVLALGGGRRRSALTGEVEEVSVAVLEVTPEEAEALALAQTRGVIHFALRGGNGEEPPVPISQARALAPWVSR